MSTNTEYGHAAGFILSEANGRRSRDNVTLEGAAGALKAGEVLSVWETGSDTGDHTKLTVGDSARDVAVCISINDVDNLTAEQSIAVIKRDCEVNGNELVWPDGITDNQKATAITQLATLGIIVRS